MKTEKRLTMALSVLVALMMLAVPLASSSNLFVDGGQTNSNGDAPLSAESTSVGGVSIDDIKIIDDEYSYKTYLPESYWETYEYADNIGLPWMVIYYTISETLSGNLSISVGKTSVNLSTDSKDNISVGSHWIAFHLKTPSPTDGVDYLPITEGLQKGTYEIKVSIDTESKHYATANFAYATNAYNVDFILNDIGGAVSLNETTIDLPNDEVNKVSWYITEDKNIRAVVVGPNVTIEYLISKLAATNVIKKDGYTLDVWKDSNNVSYQNTDKLPNVQNVIAADMTVTANWNIKGDEYAALTLNVAGDITSDKTYVKAFILDKDKKIEFGTGTGKNALIASIPGISQMGYDVVKETNVQIYEMKVTSSNGNEVKDGTVLSTDDSLTVTYKMNDVLYQKITVSSDMFNKDVILYAPANDDFTYYKVFEALKKYNGSDSELYGVKQSGTYATDNSYVTSDEYYKIIGFDGIKGNLESNKNASNNVKLDVSLNEYKVMFMVNGKFEVVSVAYGENPLDKCTLISGMTVDHWVTYSKNDSSYNFDIFNFTTSGIKSIEEKAAKADKDKVVETFIACFYPNSQTGYAVFNAKGVSSNDNPNAYFGSEDVTEIIVTGKVGDSIPMADAPSSSKDHWLFFGWNTTKTWKAGEKDLFIAYGENKDVVTYTAVWDDYKYAVTFYNGNDVVGVAYYPGDVTIGNDGMLTNIVGIQYDGKLYKYAADDDKFKEAYNKVLYTSKDGYNLKQWNDIDGKEAIAIKKIINDTKTDVEFDVKIKEIKSDINLYAKFDPKEYTIAYNSAIAAYPNPMSQQGFVDESLKLLGDATFNNEGYKLVSWNTRADGNGTSYSLGSDFSLNGSQFEDLKDDNGKVTITLYAIWDSVGGSGSGSGSSGDNGDDNTNTYLLAGILIVIIILIIVVAVILRKK